MGGLIHKLETFQQPLEPSFSLNCMIGGLSYHIVLPIKIKRKFIPMLSMELSLPIKPWSSEPTPSFSSHLHNLSPSPLLQAELPKPSIVMTLSHRKGIPLSFSISCSTISKVLLRDREAFIPLFQPLSATKCLQSRSLFLPNSLKSQIIREISLGLICLSRTFHAS